MIIEVCEDGGDDQPALFFGDDQFLIEYFECDLDGGYFVLQLID